MITQNNSIKQIFGIGFLGIAVLILLSGCSANYGSYRRNSEVKQAFESRQVPAEYQYYYFGLTNEPVVIFGIEPKYELRSVMWKNVSADTEVFRDLVGWVWEDYDYYRFGAEILDPEGKKVGILYTSVQETLFKFGPDNRITVIPNTPFLWGPDGVGGGDAWR